MSFSFGIDLALLPPLVQLLDPVAPSAGDFRQQAAFRHGLRVVGLLVDSVRGVLQFRQAQAHARRVAQQLATHIQPPAVCDQATDGNVPLTDAWWSFHLFMSSTPVTGDRVGAFDKNGGVLLSPEQSLASMLQTARSAAPRSGSDPSSGSAGGAPVDAASFLATFDPALVAPPRGHFPVQSPEEGLGRLAECLVSALEFLLASCCARPGLPSDSGPAVEYFPPPMDHLVGGAMRGLLDCWSWDRAPSALGPLGSSTARQPGARVRAPSLSSPAPTRARPSSDEGVELATDLPERLAFDGARLAGEARGWQDTGFAAGTAAALDTHHRFVTGPLAAVATASGLECGQEALFSNFTPEMAERGAIYLLTCLPRTLQDLHLFCRGMPIDSEAEGDDASRMPSRLYRRMYRAFHEPFVAATRAHTSGSTSAAGSRGTGGDVGSARGDCHAAGNMAHLVASPGSAWPGPGSPGLGSWSSLLQWEMNAQPVADPLAPLAERLNALAREAQALAAAPGARLGADISNMTSHAGKDDQPAAGAPGLWPTLASQHLALHFVDLSAWCAALPGAGPAALPGWISSVDGSALSGMARAFLHGCPSAGGAVGLHPAESLDLAGRRAVRRLLGSFTLGSSGSRGVSGRSTPGSRLILSESLLEGAEDPLLDRFLNDWLRRRGLAMEDELEPPRLALAALPRLFQLAAAHQDIQVLPSGLPLGSSTKASTTAEADMSWHVGTAPARGTSGPWLRRISARLVLGPGVLEAAGMPTNHSRWALLPASPLCGAFLGGTVAGGRLARALAGTDAPRARDKDGLALTLVGFLDVLSGRARLLSILCPLVRLFALDSLSELQVIDAVSKPEGAHSPGTGLGFSPADLVLVSGFLASTSRLAVIRLDLATVNLGQLSLLPSEADFAGGCRHCGAPLPLAPGNPPAPQSLLFVLAPWLGAVSLLQRVQLEALCDGCSAALLAGLCGPSAAYGQHVARALEKSIHPAPGFGHIVPTGGCAVVEQAAPAASGRFLRRWSALLQGPPMPDPVGSGRAAGSLLSQLVEPQAVLSAATGRCGTMADYVQDLDWAYRCHTYERLTRGSATDGVTSSASSAIMNEVAAASSATGDATAAATSTAAGSLEIAGPEGPGTACSDLATEGAPHLFGDSLELIIDPRLPPELDHLAGDPTLRQLQMAYIGRLSGVVAETSLQACVKLLESISRTSFDVNGILLMSEPARQPASFREMRHRVAERPSRGAGDAAPLPASSLQMALAVRSMVRLVLMQATGVGSTVSAVSLSNWPDSSPGQDHHGMPPEALAAATVERNLKRTSRARRRVCQAPSVAEAVEAKYQLAGRRAAGFLPAPALRQVDLPLGHLVAPALSAEATWTDASLCGRGLAEGGPVYRLALGPADPPVDFSASQVVALQKERELQIQVLLHILAISIALTIDPDLVLELPGGPGALEAATTAAASLAEGLGGGIGREFASSSPPSDFGPLDPFSMADSPPVGGAFSLPSGAFGNGSHAGGGPLEVCGIGSGSLSAASSSPPSSFLVDPAELAAQAAIRAAKRPSRRRTHGHPLPGSNAPRVSALQLEVAEDFQHLLQLLDALSSYGHETFVPSGENSSRPVSGGLPGPGAAAGPSTPPPPDVAAAAAAATAALASLPNGFAGGLAGFLDDVLLPLLALCQDTGLDLVGLPRWLCDLATTLGPRMGSPSGTLATAMGLGSLASASASASSGSLLLVGSGSSTMLMGSASSSLSIAPSLSSSSTTTTTTVTTMATAASLQAAPAASDGGLVSEWASVLRGTLSCLDREALRRLFAELFRYVGAHSRRWPELATVASDEESDSESLTLMDPLGEAPSTPVGAMVGHLSGPQFAGPEAASGIRHPGGDSHTAGTPSGLVPGLVPGHSPFHSPSMSLTRSVLMRKRRAETPLSRQAVRGRPAALADSVTPVPRAAGVGLGIDRSPSLRGGLPGPTPRKRAALRTSSLCNLALAASPSAEMLVAESEAEGMTPPVGPGARGLLFSGAASHQLRSVHGAAGGSGHGEGVLPGDLLEGYDHQSALLVGESSPPGLPDALTVPASPGTSPPGASRHTRHASAEAPVAFTSSQLLPSWGQRPDGPPMGSHSSSTGPSTYPQTGPGHHLHLGPSALGEESEEGSLARISSSPSASLCVSLHSSSSVHSLASGPSSAICSSSSSTTQLHEIQNAFIMGAEFASFVVPETP
ncbi:hypothetical protein H696_02980 [Fonticula alba]|uniref:HECT domain-containing protein n=1 Tax=Fonticula alba TaxID=691883 RepID=A0A058Z9M6_FONAL|nr:hypothetical protein H696_02980 [Fonticula alba]KCV70623.1 hypothetical protein H696_02980 [Fonticula alba]|eukprot:XP_009495139.1 hypothetical protein H696_02980 [Fonticula alba]